MRARGQDVVVGLVETYGRRDTEAQLGDLEVIPKRRIEYRGVTLEEMDLDAILQRKPQVCVVDELAHSNAPGSRHQKRYEDVLALLDAGIHVLTAVNIQHLETLNDAVAKATGIRVRETVPDTFLDRATGRTTNPKYYAGGDCVNGGREVVDAVADGKRAALAILEALRG